MRYKTAYTYILTGLCLVLLLQPPPPSFAALATVHGQYVNFIQNLKHRTVKIQEIRDRLASYRRMHQKLGRLSNREVHQAQANIRDLLRLVTDNRTAVAELENYDSLYHGTDHYTSAAVAEAATSWVENNHNIARNALSSLHLQGVQLDQEDAAMDAISQSLQSADGQAEMLGALYQISVVQINQMQSLRQLIATQVKLQATQVGTAADAAAHDKAQLYKYKPPPKPESPE